MRIGLAEFLVAIGATLVAEVILNFAGGLATGWKGAILVSAAVITFLASALIRGRGKDAVSGHGTREILSGNRSFGRLEISDIEISRPPEGRTLSGNRGWISSIIKGVKIGKPDDQS